jgi:Succinylglutamate desuccinylase / Aspartoacylase family
MMIAVDWQSHDARRGIVIVLLALLIAAGGGVTFARMHHDEEIVSGAGVTQRKMLSAYDAQLAGSPADTPIFILEGKEPGATMLLIGGCHPQEISGFITAVVTVENAIVQKGRLIVVPQANRSGFTYTEPLEGYPHTFTIDTAQGARWFRLGMRLSNPVHQWPDPDLYIHPQSGEGLVGWEARNLNRNFPGNARGRHTARVASALTTLAKIERVDLVLDLHEAYPEYPIINMIVAHERAFEVASLTKLMLESRNIRIDLMASPKKLRGLSHREFGDNTSALAMLAETANPAMGRFRGRTDEELVTQGKDPNYVKAAKLGRLFVPFNEEGHPLSKRVSRHLATISEMLDVYNEIDPAKQLTLSNLPPFERVATEGIGPFLKPTTRVP